MDKKDEDRRSRVEGISGTVGDYPFHFGRSGTVVAPKVIEGAVHVAGSGMGGHNNQLGGPMTMQDVPPDLPPPTKWPFHSAEITPAMIDAARDVLAYHMEPGDALPGDNFIGMALEAALNAKNAGPA